MSRAAAEQADRTRARGRSPRALAPEEVLGRLLALDDQLGLQPYYSEQAIFYNPGGAAPLGVIFAAIKDHDGPNDRAAALSRPGVYRMAFQLPRDQYVARLAPSRRVRPRAE